MSDQYQAKSDQTDRSWHSYPRALHTVIPGVTLVCLYTTLAEFPLLISSNIRPPVTSVCPYYKPAM